MKKSRRTTLWGTLAGLSAAYASFTPDPTHKAVAGGAAALFTALMGVSARDHNVSSKSAGVESPPDGSVPVRQAPPGTVTPLILLGLLSVTVLSPGCATTSQPQSLENKAKAVAWGATTKILEQHPEWQAGFVQARDDLQILSEAKTITATELAAIVNRLPTKKLQNRDAALYVNAAMMFFEDDLVVVAVDNPDAARAVARGMASGIHLALTP